MGYNTHDIGDKVRLSAPFTLASNGTALDPDVVKVSVKDPSDNVVTYVYGTDVEVVKDSTGNYHIDISPDEAGFWFYRWWSTGDGQASDEQRFYVRELEAV